MTPSSPTSLDSRDPAKLVSAREARVVEPVVPEPDPLALREVENQHAQAIHKAEQGWVGKVCGSRGEKSGNVAFLVIVACFVLISVGAVCLGTQ